MASTVVQVHNMSVIILKYASVIKYVSFKWLKKLRMASTPVHNLSVIILALEVQIGNVPL